MMSTWASPAMHVQVNSAERRYKRMIQGNIPLSLFWPKSGLAEIWLGQSSHKTLHGTLKWQWSAVDLELALQLCS